MTDDLLEETLPPVPTGYAEVNWRSGFARVVGPIYERDADKVTYRRAFRVSSHHTNGTGDCHGGMLTALADMAFGHAVSVVFNRYWVTVRLLTDFVSVAHVGDWVEGAAEITGEEDGFITVSGKIWVGERTVMTGSGIFKALGERPS